MARAAMGEYIGGARCGAPGAERSFLRGGSVLFVVVAVGIRI